MTDAFQPSRRRLLGALSAAALAAALPRPARAASDTLRIGYQKYGTLVLLKAQGTLEKRLAPLGIQVKWAEFPGGPQLLEALNVGRTLAPPAKPRRSSPRPLAPTCNMWPMSRRRPRARRLWWPRIRR